VVATISIPTPTHDTSDDYVHGGSGADHIVGGLAQGGVDRPHGEGANDFIDANQRDITNPVQVTKEIIDCGVAQAMRSTSTRVWT
jgi:hypothetical protein